MHEQRREERIKSIHAFELLEGDILTVTPVQYRYTSGHSPLTELYNVLDTVYDFEATVEINLADTVYGD